MAATPYVLSVGTIEARKNHAVLFKAFARMVAKDPALPHRLVLAGGTSWIGHEAVFKLVGELGLSDRVVPTGFSESLPLIYAGADAFVYPSLYEGFGLPPLEAMACGVPVLAADATSLPEVVGDAGVLFEPHDAVALADHLTRVLADSEYRADLVARGQARAKLFSWQQTAACTLTRSRPLRKPAQVGTDFNQVQFAGRTSARRCRSTDDGTVAGILFCLCARTWCHWRDGRSVWRRSRLT